MPIGPRPKPTESRIYIHLPASPPTRCVSFSKIAVAKLITLFLYSAYRCWNWRHEAQPTDDILPSVASLSHSLSPFPSPSSPSGSSEPYFILGERDI